MPYIQYTDQQKEQARRTNISDIIHRTGGTVKRSGSEEVWLDGDQKVTIRGNLWYHQYEQKGGDAISFVRKFMDKSYPEALEFLLGSSAGTLTISPPIPKKVSAPLELPEKHDNMRRVYYYLTHRRGLDRAVVDTFVKRGMLYESSDYHNAVFIGFDKAGKPKHASLRGTSPASAFRGNKPNSLPEYSFHWHGTSDTLYLFEAPIDMLSYISMHKEGWQRHSYAACCGVGERVLFQMLKDNPNIKSVKLCLDNDEPGQTANKRISDKLCLKGIPSEVLVPAHKDWNEDLLSPERIDQTQQEADLCPRLQP